MCFTATTQRRKRLCSEFLLVTPRQFLVFNHEETNDRRNGSHTRVENEYQFEACCVPMREYIAGHQWRQSQWSEHRSRRVGSKNRGVVDDGSNCGWGKRKGREVVSQGIVTVANKRLASP